MKISDNTSVAMPMRNLIAIIGAVAVGTMAYFNIVEQLNKHSTTLELMAKDQEHNTEFRIKWPRGEMGSLPADAEQFMLIEDLYKTVEKLEKEEMGYATKEELAEVKSMIEEIKAMIEKKEEMSEEVQEVKEELSAVEKVTHNPETEDKKISFLYGQSRPQNTMDRVMAKISQIKK